MPNDQFFVIRLVNMRTGQHGFLINGSTTRNTLISPDAYTADVTRFDSRTEADDAIYLLLRNHRHIKAYTMSNNELVDQHIKGIAPATTGMAYIENEAGERCCYDTENKRYYFANAAVGFCVFKTMSGALQFVAGQNFGFATYVKPLDKLKQHG